MEGFRTPVPTKPVSRIRKDVGETPVRIPESPNMTLLGLGTGVRVYSFERSPRPGCALSPWAVKRVNKHHLSEGSYQERLEVEAKLLNKMKHPNIIGFRAYVPGKDGRPCLVMEECEAALGDLIEQRSEKCYGPFPANAILKVALDVAKALDYLHTEFHLLHGDIKSFNVLIKGDFEIAKLCDFGVCVALDANGVMDKAAVGPEGGYVGTECWMAPEGLEEGPITSKVDIFSFGLVLWEMLALSPPHMQDLDSDMSSLTEEESFDEASFISKLGTRPSLPTTPLDDEYEPVLHIFNWCTETDPNSRPSAKQVVEYLEGVLSAKSDHNED